MSRDITPPDDAGVWAEDLADILGRIPDGWGRSIACGPGWYPILAHLNERIRRLAPHYEVHQVKEKYGTLRFYYGDYGCRLIDPMPGDPEPAECPRGASEAERQERWAQHDAWSERFDAWLQTPEGAGWDAHLDAVRAQIDTLIREAEAASARTCERCGAPGGAWCSQARSPWYVTACARCAPEGYIRATEWQAWYESMRPEWRRKERLDFLSTVPRERRLLAVGDTRYHLREATWAATPAEAVAALETGQIREVLLGDDLVGQAAIAWLMERYEDHAAANASGVTGMHIVMTPPDAPMLIALSEHVDLTPLHALGLRELHIGVDVIYDEDASIPA